MISNSELLYRLFYSSVVLMVSWFPRLVNPMLDNFCSCNNQERLHQCSWAWVSQVKTMMILCKLLWQKWHLQVSYGGCSVITKLNLFRILKVKDLLSSQNYGLFMKFWWPKKKTVTNAEWLSVNSGWQVVQHDAQLMLAMLVMWSSENVVDSPQDHRMYLVSTIVIILSCFYTSSDQSVTQSLVSSRTILVCEVWQFNLVRNTPEPDLNLPHGWGRKVLIRRENSQIFCQGKFQE